MSTLRDRRTAELFNCWSGLGEKRRGLETGPEQAVGDGVLGFWKALREMYGEPREQRFHVLT